jgi:Rod binding domain-containing protein
MRQQAREFDAVQGQVLANLAEMLVRQLLSCTALFHASPDIFAPPPVAARRCVMGQQARKFDAVQGQVLANLAEMLVRQLEEKWVDALQVGERDWRGS